MPDNPNGQNAQTIADQSVQKDIENIDDRVKRAERWMIGLTIAIAFFALCSVVVGVFQWSAMSGQLAEMRSGGSDTHALAVQAKAQTDKMGESLTKTDELIAKQTAQAAATNDLAIQAKRSADIADRTLKATVESASQDRRPWVGLQLLQCNNCRMETDGSLAIGDLSAVLVNTGKTPAIDMIVNSVLATAKAGDPIPTYDSIERNMQAREERAFSIPSYLPPDMAADIAKTMEFEKRKILPSKEVLAPNAARGIQIIAGLRQGREKMVRMEDKIVVYGLGKIIYYDMSRKIQHVTMFCVMNDFGASFRYCTTGNEMD